MKIRLGLCDYTDVTLYGWDHRNRLISVTTQVVEGTSDEIITYQAYAFDRKVAKHVDIDPSDSIDTSEYYVYDGEDVLWDFVDADGEQSGDPVIDKRYLHGPATDRILAEDDYTGGVLWYLSDNLGTVRDLAEAVTNGAGDVTDVVIDEHFSYDSFGNVLTGDTSKTRYLYTGREFDTDTGLQYNRARWYDPATGNWLSEDPIGFEAGDTNLTRYVGNGVTNATDPTGLIGFWDWLWSVPDSKRGSQADKTIAEGNLNRASADPHNPFALSEVFARERMRGADGAIRDAQGLTHGAIEWSAGGVGNVGRSAAGKGLNKFAQGSQRASKGSQYADDVGRTRAVGGNKPLCPLPESGRTVIGKVKDLKSLRPGENTLLKHLPNQGTPRANWYQNSSVLRQEIRKGKPIRDASLLPNGELRSYPGSFLEAERNLLRNQGWQFNSTTGLWSPVK